MKDRVANLYEAVTMPEACEEKIRQAAGEKLMGTGKSRRWKPGPAAVLAALALVVLLSPPVRAAMEDLAVKYVFPELGITVYEVNTEDTVGLQVVAYDTESEAFAQLREGRLYFTGNGEDLDITDQIAEDAPFYYEYQDPEAGTTMLLAVGYSGSLENFGIYEFVKEPDGTWVTGTGRNFLDPETGTRHPWVDLVWAKWNIPWPMPGEEGDYDIQLTENQDGIALTKK